MKDVRLVGLDFGTTTSRCVAATARLARNTVSGRHDLSDIRETFRSSTVLTPFSEAGLDIPRLEDLVDGWLSAAGGVPKEIFGGGALVTGLAAQQPNSRALTEMIRSRMNEVLVATAGDPCLEAWLAFQANAGPVSRATPDRWVINLDIGGGTTNIAVGRAGEVLRTGSLFVGARHIQVEPGTYRIINLSPYACGLLENLKMDVHVGDSFNSQQLALFLDRQIELIESALIGDRAAFEQPTARFCEHVAFEPPDDVRDPIYCLSGGVGELAYKVLRGEPLPGTTEFGDLGIDLALRIAASPRWAARLAGVVPQQGGRATVYGLLLFATQVSGSTLYLPDPSALPLRDIPILGRIAGDSTDERIRDIFQLVSRSSVGGCAVVSLERNDAATVRSVGERVGSALREAKIPAATPLVLIVRENVGKALGGYVSQWGATALRLVVLDEIEPLDARFVQIGTLRDQLVPVSFYGMN